MNPKHDRPSAEELAQLSAYLDAQQHGAQPVPGELGFPSGLAGELLMLADGTEPDPGFAARLELQLRQAAAVGSRVSRPGWWHALWQPSPQPERNTTMKRMLAFSLIGLILVVLVWITLPSIFPSSTQTQVAVTTPSTSTPVSTPLSSLTPSVIPPTSQSPVAINFTPQPIPSQPPTLPSLVDALNGAYGGSGMGNLPQVLPLTLSASLPSSPAEVTAYYRLENTPLTLEAAGQIATQWGLSARFYIPGWMHSITPNDVERSYIAVDGMQTLSMWNAEISYHDLSILPVFGGHQYPQSNLPSSQQAGEVASQYLSDRGFLDYSYQIDLSNYAYGIVGFNPVLDGLLVKLYSASVTFDPQGQVGSAWVSREQYQSVGIYPILDAQSAWDILSSGQSSSQVIASYSSAQDGNPQYWGHVYPAGQTAHLFGVPTFLSSTETGTAPYVQLNNLILNGDISGLLEYLQSGQGYIHAWGQVQDVNGARQLQLAGWEPFDEFSGYFDGIVRRTVDGAFLELGDGRQFALPDLPADVPSDIPLYAQGGLVDNTLEWFILQVHPSSESQTPPDLSQAQAIIDQVELVYLAPPLTSSSSDPAIDPADRMLIPAWSFTGRLTNVNGADLVYHAYVQAVDNP